MSFLSVIDALIITPLKLLFEFLYFYAYKLTGSTGVSIIVISLTVNFLILPLYKRADEIQAEERNIQAKMASRIKRIKKAFKGDERFLMLQEYYRINHYKPAYALRSSISLILQIPFFIAAYRFLSELPDMKLSGFGVLDNLASPDALISIGSISINVLPVLMTLINILSGMIYTKGHSLREKIQVYGLAAVFLVLLYQSPSGLVFYWLLNNVFSLVKSTVYKFKDKKRATAIALSLLGAVILVYSITYEGELISNIIIVITGLLFQIPMLLQLMKKEARVRPAEVRKADSKLFVLGGVFMSVLLGVLIPSQVIASSTAEFILKTDVHSPVRYILFSFLTALGAFVLWGGLFYYLADNRNRQRANAVIWILSAAGTVNFFVFGKSESILSSDLKFDVGLIISKTSMLINGAVIIAVTILVFFIMKKFARFIRIIAPVMIAVITVISGINIHKISTEMPDIRRVFENSSSETPVLSFSSEGKNVVVIMLDRAIGVYVPYMFQERPELAEQFSGFTYYPNTVSFGMRTVVAAPALFAGYDYTPERFNERSDDMLRTKHDEALLTMPVLFSDAGYDVTVMDPPNAGYCQIPDLSIYDPYPGIKAYNTEQGLFRDSNESDKDLEYTWKRNFFCYSIMKVSPLFIQSAVYTDGTYFESINTMMTMNNIGENKGHFVVSPAHMNYFCDSYNVLCALPSMTELSHDSEYNFFLIQNGTAHNIMPLKEPEYEPAYEFDNTEFDNAHMDRFTCNGRTITMTENYQLVHYQCNMAAFIQLGKWMDYLKEIGAYDNTRIVIVSDHGWPTGQFADMLFLDGENFDTIYNSEDAMGYNPVLLYKDFGSSEPFETDYTFMTNADTPYLAMHGIMDNPINPFTSRPVFYPDAKDADMHIMYTDRWSLDGNTEKVFTNTIWYSLSNQNIFDKNNWSEVPVQ